MMAKPFRELREKMSPEAQRRASEKAAAMKPPDDELIDAEDLDLDAMDKLFDELDGGYDDTPDLTAVTYTALVAVGVILGIVATSLWFSV